MEEPGTLRLLNEVRASRFYRAFCNLPDQPAKRLALSYIKNGLDIKKAIQKARRQACTKTKN